MKFKFIQNSPDKLSKASDDCDFCGTGCQIVDDSGAVVSTGLATLHPGDNFSRPVGRKISAGRAIRAYIPRLGRRDHAGRAARFDLWKQLFDQSPSTQRGGR